MWLAAIALAAITACDTPGVTLIDPDVAGGPDSVTFHVSLEDTLLARALGWADGVPGAVVMLQRIGEDYRPDSMRTDSTGRVYIDDQLPGFYRVAVHRLLSQDEAAPLGGKPIAFGTGSKLRLSSSSNIVLSLDVGKHGSLIFSELFVVQQYLANEYMWFQYFEFYNNGETTLYVDGMIFGRAWHLYKDYVPYPCVTTEPMRNDSAGIWATFFHRFPGTGHDYPVYPGETVTVAMDAVDHSVVHASFPNLSNADFELEGTADADNPDVPNMPDVGLSASLRGHGLDASSKDVFFLARSVDVGTLRRTRDGATGSEWVRFPTSAVLDVVSLHDGRGYADAQITPCRVSVHPRFDKLEGGFLNTYIDTTFSFHRRVLPAFAGSSMPILHDVNTSFIDIVTGPHTPGEIRY